MTKLFLIPVFLLCISFQAFTQYWQQKIDYTLSVQLNDETHELTGNESFDYNNLSPDALTEIYIHVWPNAYKDKNSALAKQLYHGGNKELYYGEDKNRGYIKNLDFKVDGNSCKWDFDPENPDIVKIILEKPLLPNSKITISTPFMVKIPSGEISRLGHIGQSYQITQWYPKPAVYDHKGWHPIPYLNQGEFYSEYGSFDVSITIPKNYIVGATGVLQNPDEVAFMDEMAKKTTDNMQELIALLPGEKRDSFPETAKEWKTLRFVQDNVHDFAWFADKRFQVLKGEITLPHSQRKVTSWALFTPANVMKWKNAIEYINDGTYYYSKWNGDYPYAAVTAIDGTISAGGGMEYPMITVIGNASSSEELEVVIVHEVGHNWFYGILGSNERQHGWMDEGMNTANEMRYVATKYPENKRMSDMFANGKLHFNDLDHHDMGDIMYRTLATLGMDQPIETHSTDFSSANYGAIMYQKTGLVFQYLRDYLGEELYDQCMQTYYDTYKFKHPYPEDMKRIFEGISGKKLDWVFIDLIQTTNVLDYKLQNVKHDKLMNTFSVKVSNKGGVQGPASVTSYDENNKVLETHWTDANEKKSTLYFTNGFARKFVIDSDRNIPEINRDNNRVDLTKTIFCRKVEPVKFEFGIGDNEADKNIIFWLPAMAFNASDKSMLGITFHNYGIPFKPFQYFISPMYSFGRNSVSGIVELSHSCFPKGFPRMVKTGISIKSFGLADNPKNTYQSYFVAATPYVSINLIPDRTPIGFTHDLLIKALVRSDQWGIDNILEYGAKVTHKIGWAFDNFDYESQIQAEAVYGKSSIIDDLSNYSRISTTQTMNLRYLNNKMNRNIKLRLYGGYNLDYNPSGFYGNDLGRYSINLLGASGYQDIFVENYYLNRSLSDGYQYNDDMGGFRTGNNVLKMSNYWMLSSNITVQLPVKPNIFVAFADFGVFDAGTSISKLYNAGLGINLADFLGVYFPLVQNDMDDLYGNYSNSIRMTLKINPYNLPLKVSKLINR